MLRKLSWGSFYPCGEASCSIDPPCWLMLRSSRLRELRLSALGWILRADRENVLAPIKSAIAKSLVENTTRNLRSLYSLGQGAGGISLVFADSPESLELRKENAVRELSQRLIDGSGRHVADVLWFDYLAPLA